MLDEGKLQFSWQQYILLSMVKRSLDIHLSIPSPTSPSHAQYLFTFIYPDPGPGTLGTLGTLAQLTLSSQVLASDK